MTTQTKPAAKRAVFHVQRERAEGNTYSMTIAANDASRNPFDEIRLGGGQFHNYLRNPVVLWSHDASALPIGRTTKLQYVDGKLRADFEFLPDDPMAERVKRAWDLGFINAASISFMPLEIDESDRSKPFGIVSQWDLLEWSLVAVPADPDALRAAARALNVPEEVFRAEGDMADVPAGETPAEGDQPPAPTPEELAARIDELTAQVTDLSGRIDALESDEQPPADDSGDGSGEAAAEETDGRDLSKVQEEVNGLLAALQETN